MNGLSMLHVRADRRAVRSGTGAIGELGPKKAKPFIAIVIPGSSSNSFFLGSAIAEFLHRKQARLVGAAVIP
jgi:hypothetical protein